MCKWIFIYITQKLYENIYDNKKYEVLEKKSANKAKTNKRN